MQCAQSSGTFAVADRNVAILLDTKGPEIRTGFFKESCKGKIHLKVHTGRPHTSRHRTQDSVLRASSARRTIQRLRACTHKPRSHLHPVPAPTGRLDCGADHGLRFQG